MTLKEKVDELNFITGSTFNEDMNEDCIGFYYREIAENNLSLLDTDEYVTLNTIMGYNIGRENALKLSRDLWEHNVEVLELQMDMESRQLIYDSANRCSIKLDWSKWKDGNMEEYGYFPES